jgi:mono/diheme cytochrome c family protein
MAAVVLGVMLVPGSLIADVAKPHAIAPSKPAGGHDHGGHDHGGHADGARPHGGEAHVHAPVPPEYRSAHVPAAAWTSPPLIARGREIYMARCALCHGDRGDGQGPAAAGLPIKPPSFQDTRMVGEMAGNYWFWRVSEGGLVEPFASKGSVMPAWKDELSILDRWAVIAYTHTLSGHRGPHVVSEHPQMLGGAQATHGSAETAAPAGMHHGSSPAGSHKH